MSVMNLNDFKPSRARACKECGTEGPELICTCGVTVGHGGIPVGDTTHKERTVCCGVGLL